MRLIFAALLLAAPAFAAHVTDVADAADERHPLEVDLDVTFEHLQRDTKISREQATTGGIILEDELQHSRAVDAFLFRLNIGIWHDLELHAFAPFAVRDVQDWKYASTTTAANSTLTNNTLNVSGCGTAGSCSTVQPIVTVPGKSERRGLGDPTVGIAWGPINEQRELRLKPEVFPEGKPVSTWVIGVDWTLPIGGGVDDPSRYGPNVASAPSAGAEAKKAHVLTLWTAFSKRYRVLEPYVRVSGSLPISTSSAYDNCSNRGILSNAAPNCDNSFWKGKTGYKPPIEAGFLLGAELVAAEDKTGDQRLAFDLRGDVRYHGQSRNYTQVADALGKLTYADEYVTTVGALGLYGRLARWFHLRVYGTVGFDTAHYLTHEEIVDVGGVDISTSAGQAHQNPNYDFRLDQPGRRLRAEPAFVWGVAGSLALNF
jgi:hypothetical protein